MKSFATGLCLILLLVPGLAMADLDAAGNDPTSIGTTGDDPGDPCGTCPAPSGDSGVAFKDGDLHVIAGGRINQLVNCAIVGSTPINQIGLPFGLGYDTQRQLWIVSDPGADRVMQVNLGGGTVNSWPSPGSGPVGAAYDSMRDLYWVSDFNSNAITSINPTTGLPGPSLPVPAGSRIAGTGYDRATDTIMYHGRNEATTYCISAETGALLVSFPVPNGGGNNGQGAGIAPDGNGWLSHFEQDTLYCVEKARATPVEQSTWGSIKSLYE